MSKNRIPTEELKQIVSDPEIDLKVRALIVVIYACGCRVGELLRYKHKRAKPEAKARLRGSKQEQNIGYRPEDYIHYETYGLTFGNVKHFADRIEFIIPNFKNKNMDEKAGFILKEDEKWMYDVYIEYSSTMAGIPNQQVFPISYMYARWLVDAALKKYNPKYSTHYLRHSRATMLGCEKRIGVICLKKFLGHASMESTDVYTHADIADVISATKKGYAENKEIEPEPATQVIVETKEELNAP